MKNVDPWVGVVESSSGVVLSPFDAIARERPDGAEYWHARDLMPLLGYSKWERFADAIDRARASAQAQGRGAEGFFPAPGKTSDVGGRPREDFYLSRFACYLIAMNGDPRKPEIAMAQAYFATRTREAELASRTRPAMSRDELMATALIEAQRTIEDAQNRAIAAEARAEVSEHRLDAIEAAEGPTITAFHKHYFSDVTAREFFEFLYRKGLLIDQRGARGRDARGRLRDGYQHMHPTAKGKEFFYLRSTVDSEGVRRERTRVRPGVAEVGLARFLMRRGLPINEELREHVEAREVVVYG